MDSQYYRNPPMAGLKFTKFLKLPFPTVLTRDTGGKPGPQYQMADSPHIFFAIMICREMLDLAKVQDGLEKIAVRYKAARPSSWWTQGSDRVNPKEVTITFVRKIVTTFPRVFVDYSLEYPNYRG